MGVQLPEPAAAVNVPEVPTKLEQPAVDKGQVDADSGHDASVLKNGVQTEDGDTTEADAKAAALKDVKEAENGKEDEHAEGDEDEDGEDEDFQAAEDDDAAKEDDDEDDEEDDDDDDEEGDEDGEETTEGAKAKMGLSTEIVSQFLTKEHIGGRALLVAAKEDDVETITKLFETADEENKEGEEGKAEKVDIDAKDPYHYTALHLAAENGAVNAVRKLISLKASIELPTRMHQCRPLHYAATNGHAEVIQVLLDAGADINARTDDGRTPLMQAVLSKHVECVKVLMKNKADASIKSDDGKAPADVAESREISDALEAPAEKKARTE